MSRLRRNGFGGMCRLAGWRAGIAKASFKVFIVGRNNFWRVCEKAGQGAFMHGYGYASVGRFL